MEDLLIASEWLNQLVPVTNTMSESIFYPLYCMLLEEWCKHNSSDILEVLECISDTIKAVNIELGKY